MFEGVTLFAAVSLNFMGNLFAVMDTTEEICAGFIAPFLYILARVQFTVLDLRMFDKQFSSSTVLSASNLVPPVCASAMIP